MISDRQMWWNRHRLWVPAPIWCNGSIAGAVRLTEVVKTVSGVTTSCSVQGINFGAASGHTASAVVQAKIVIPSVFNPEFPLGFRVHWVNQCTTSSTTYTFNPTMLAAVKTVGTDVMADVAAGALNTPIPAQTAVAVLSAGSLNRTPRGIMNANWATRTKVFGGQMLEFSFSWGAAPTNYTIAATAQLWVLGLMIDYVPMMTRFPHQEIDSPEDDAMA